MSFFSLRNKLRLARSLITKDHPIYVQFYVTARCNLECEQCNVIFANSDVAEIDLLGIQKIAENLEKIGVSIILLTGGEPFARKDLPEIVHEFSSRGIHVRIQTNGLASQKALQACIQAGANDISISLDSIRPSIQDQINGGFEGSWEKAIEEFALVNNLFPTNSFAAIGCVMAPRNLAYIPDLIRFASEIGWYVSLVPAHTTPQHSPRSFSSFDSTCRFSESHYLQVKSLLSEIKQMRDQGFLLYDSDEYLDDIYRFVTKEPLQWRRRNKGVCDSPNLYFAIIPNGDMAVCCDYRLYSKISTYANDFPERFFESQTRNEVRSIASACSGCMYGSFPEMTITARYLKPLFHRFVFFNSPKKERLKKMTKEEMLEIAASIRARNSALYS